jgi:hypothetical protein
MKTQYVNHNPVSLEAGEWHLPLVDQEDREVLGHDVVALRKISTGRCARVSYLTHDGRRDHAEDITLHDRLVNSGHWSPFEHVAQALPTPERSGNFRGWKQYRKEFPTEHIGPFMP